MACKGQAQQILAKPGHRIYSRDPMGYCFEIFAPARPLMTQRQTPTPKEAPPEDGSSGNKQSVTLIMSTDLDVRPLQNMYPYPHPMKSPQTSNSALGDNSPPGG